MTKRVMLAYDLHKMVLILCQLFIRSATKQETTLYQSLKQNVFKYVVEIYPISLLQFLHAIDFIGGTLN